MSFTFDFQVSNRRFHFVSFLYPSSTTTLTLGLKRSYFFAPETYPGLFRCERVWVFSTNKHARYHYTWSSSRRRFSHHKGPRAPLRREARERGWKCSGSGRHSLNVNLQLPAVGPHIPGILSQNTCLRESQEGSSENCISINFQQPIWANGRLDQDISLLASMWQLAHGSWLRYGNTLPYFWIELAGTKMY